MFVTGDTGVMHLAATEKRPGSDDAGGPAPRNATRIIALFGGTNPALYGYSRRSIIVGRGRKEQRAYRPGIAKESYRLHGRCLFDHIAPQDITQALEGADCPGREHSGDDVCSRYRDPPLPVQGHLHTDMIL
jgi:hypothetical protein